MQSMTENFIGRKKELAQLIQWLENADDFTAILSSR